MNLLRPLSGLRRRGIAFGRDRRGNFATIAGISSIAVMLCAGLALDYARIAHTKSIINDALDAAVLAAGAELSSGRAAGAELERNFRDFFEANLEGRSASVGNIEITRFDADQQSGRVSAEARATIKTTLLALTGTKEVAIGVPAEAVFSADAVEVAMVLDVTGSMRPNGKIEALRQAARDAIDILLPASTRGDKMRIGLVPYSWSVNAGRYAMTASAGRSQRCVTERGGAQAATDASYAVEPVLAATEQCPSQAVTALTSRRNDLVRQIDSMRSDGYTAGHIGVAWGYYMLSEHWRELWRGAEPARYADPVRKVAIVMTDGQFNTYYHNVRGSPYDQPVRSSSAALALCADMKRPKAGRGGIIIYAVAFQAPREAETLLKACASPDSGESRHFFSASDAQELRQAFAAIAGDIQKLRLSR